MRRTLFTLMLSLALLSFAFVAGGASQKEEKPWTQWTQKEAEKMLSNSPWSQTQTDTDVSEMFFSPTSDPRRSRPTGNDSSRLESGATNQSVNVKFIVRFFSARPVRRALVRLMELKQKPDAAMTEKLHAFADLKSTDSTILTFSYETTDQRYGGVAMQTLNSAITATLKNETYLEHDGKRLFLQEYVAPGRDGFGARFIFPRELNEGQPFINGSSGEVRFHTKYPGLRIDRVFKLADMMTEGQVEY